MDKGGLDPESGWITAMGVHPDQRRQGIGTALLARCLRAMQEQGHHHAWVLWTSDENADKVYGRFGFKETRRFAVLRRQF